MPFGITFFVCGENFRERGEGQGKIYFVKMCTIVGEKIQKYVSMWWWRLLVSPLFGETVKIILFAKNIWSWKNICYFLIGR